jgi:hypothetical protein
MERETSLAIARDIMLEFAAATGVSGGGRPPRRYLWTDAFAVCTFLDLHRQTGQERYRQLADSLIGQVHGTLGRHRGDDRRSGWLSGLDDREGALHPTRRGLRIGKTLNERRPGDPFDERLEWDRDGQYYHYLTKWMHALHQAGRDAAEPPYHLWAMELAKAAHAAFVYTPAPGSPKRMYWKMSVDLTRPLVPSMGHHDPLDGWITCTELMAAARKGPGASPRLDLGREIGEMAAMCRDVDWATDDPLGLGGLMSDAFRVGQLMARGYFESGELLEGLLSAALTGLNSLLGRDPFALPARARLAFREFGLSIGLRAIERLRGWVGENPGPLGRAASLQAKLKALERYEPLAETIERFWLEPGNRKADSWTEHGDINGVMLAASLAPDGFLSL